MMQIKNLSVLIMCLLLSIGLYAQQRTLTGEVSDESGPLPGVSVIVKGTTTGTTTDANGRYRLNVDQYAKTLVFSFIGMANQEVEIGGKTSFEVVMEPENIGLDEVVAIGYGTARKSDLTGAITPLKGSIVSERKTSQLSQALQGAAPGVMVLRYHNAPGATATINIRGITTLSDSNPLIIIDGVRANSINDINANDIEDISVLKDAASASIYGSCAAAGVILITTKRAETGEVLLNYNFEFGIEKPTKMASYVGAQRYMQITNELKWNDSGNPEGGEFATYSEDLINNYPELNAENPDLYPDTDWVDLILKNSAPRQSHNLSLTAGGKNVRTKASLRYDKTDGLYMKCSYERFTARINNDFTINDFLSASVNMYARRSIAKNPSTYPIYYMRISAPIYPAVWSNGLIASGNSGTNIYGVLKEGGYSNYWYDQLGGKISLDFTPFKGMKISAVIAPELNTTKGKAFVKKVRYTNYDDPDTFVGTLTGYNATNLTETRSDNYHTTTQFFANYNTKIGEHSLNLMAGYENYYLFSESLSANTKNMELSEYPYLDLKNEDDLDNSGNAYENAYRSFFGRFMYNYKNKYLVQGNIRYDGSSRFASDYRWGVFPSFSAGWIISEEPFMKRFSNLSFLKLRASWGTLGNDRIGYYPYQQSISYNTGLFFQGSDVVSSQTAAQGTYAVEDVTWETIESYDLGIDANFFDNRLSLTADCYKKLTKDMLLALEIPDYIGFGNPQQNSGTMNTKGWEFEIRWNDNIGDLRYSFAANVSNFKTKMGYLGGEEVLADKVTIEGSEYSEWYGYTTDGLFQNQEEIENSAVLNSSIKPGDIKYVDISGPDGVPDGVISAQYDKTFLGGSLPRYTYGGNIRLEYKNFDLSMVFQGVGKQNVRISSMMVQPLVSNWGSVPEIIDGNYWSAYNTESENLAAKYPRLTFTNAMNNYLMSDYWLFNGAYFRLKNVTLGYNIPESVTQKIKIKSARIYGSVSDLFTIDKYPKGWDPEVSTTLYPITTSFIFGVSVNF